jgi:hypothetical protein
MEIKIVLCLAKIALERWGETGLFGLLHGHLHKVAVHDLNQIFQLGFDHPILIFMLEQQLLIVCVLDSQIVLI